MAKRITTRKHDDDEDDDDATGAGEVAGRESLEDAPKDGLLYVRCNGEWVALERTVRKMART